jgi:signal transduction histidine kinase
MLMSVRGPCEDKREKALRELEGSLNEAMKELRTFSYLMHPPALQRQGLRASVKRYVDGFADRSGLVCRLRADRKRDKYSVHVRRSVFRIVQEGLANAYRHASATQVSIHLRRFRGLLHVLITDNGRGLRNRPGPGQKLPSRPGVGIRGIECE